VGRAAELQRLADLLAPEGCRVYLTGMGGVGKSELAVQHAYDHLEHYRGGIVRLDARQGLSAMAAQLVTFFRGHFPAVALPDDTSPTDLPPLCWSQWPASTNPPEPVLLLLDDQRGVAHGYEVERQLFQGLPPRFRRLITQREIAPAGAQVIDLLWLRRDSALELLALQAGERGKGRVEEEESDADELCAEAGDLPLALVLLGARLSGRPDLRLSQLLEDLLAKGAEAKALQQAHPELGAPRGVVEALLISWEPLSDAAKSLGLIIDNYCTHKHAKVKAWLAERPQFHVHFTPSYSSWLNQVERWFGIITERMIRRGSFRSVKELIARIETFVANFNKGSTPFMWTATADSIFEKIQRLCVRISGAGH